MMLSYIEICYLTQNSILSNISVLFYEYGLNHAGLLEIQCQENGKTYRFRPL